MTLETTATGPRTVSKLPGRGLCRIAPTDLRLGEPLPYAVYDSSGMLLLKADVTANSEDDKALLRRFGLFGPPGIIFFDARGQERKGLRVVGFMKAEPFAVVLDRALGG